MIAFDKVFFGFAAAEKEAERNPTAFQKSFYDPHEYMRELISGHKYILRGRKGGGKTAYSAHIKLSEDQWNIYAHQRSLNNFNNTTFSQIKTYDTLGGNPYISFWKCILMIECVSMIYRFEPYIQDEVFTNLVYTLNEYGFISTDEDISVTVTKLVETNSTINLKSVFQHGRKYKRDVELRGSEQIYSTIRKSIKDLYIQKKFVFIIDGLDDILNNTEFKSEIITGLIRAVDEINGAFRNTTLSIKILILIRDDILSLCRDPNLSKIKRDSSIQLTWEINGDPLSSDLLQLVNKRISETAGSPTDISQVWNEIFPNTIGNRTSIDYILDNIIYRPRDILQFFVEVQKEYIPGKVFTHDRIKMALVRYSEDYFVSAMQDELTGFFPNEVINVLPQVLSRMGSRFFYLSDFEKECDNYEAFKNVDKKRDILERLFNAGYIDQHRPRMSTDYTVFSYRNPVERFQEDHECILHRGLTRALTL